MPVKISVPAPANQTTEEILRIFGGLLKSFQQIRREEQHTIAISSPLEQNTFLATVVAALVLQYQKNGYLFRLAGPEILNRPMRLEKKNSGVDFTRLPLLPPKLKGRKDIQNALCYIVGELADNIFDHARAEVALINTHTSDNFFSLAAVDTGISIPGAYRSTNIPVQDDCEALVKAVQGFSTKTAEERGTGLPSTRKLMLKAFQGQLLLCSGNAILEDKGEVKCFPLPFYWQGTIVFAHGKFPPSKIDFYEIIGR